MNIQNYSLQGYRVKNTGKEKEQRGHGKEANTSAQEQEHTGKGIGEMAQGQDRGGKGTGLKGNGTVVRAKRVGHISEGMGATAHGK